MKPKMKTPPYLKWILLAGIVVALISVLVAMPFLTGGPAIEYATIGEGYAGTQGTVSRVPNIQIVSNATDLSNVWTMFRAGRPPQIDFQTTTCVLLMTGGPNRIQITSLPRIRNGDLAINYAATEIGGPGYSYHLLRFKADFASVNGLPVRGAGPVKLPTAAITSRLQYR